MQGLQKDGRLFATHFFTNYNFLVFGVQPIHHNSVAQIFVRLKLGKVQLFWEGYKNWHNLPHGCDIYLVIVKTKRKIAPIFVAFSGKLNFNKASFSLNVFHKVWWGKQFRLFSFYNTNKTFVLIFRNCPLVLCLFWKPHLFGLPLFVRIHF